MESKERVNKEPFPGAYLVGLVVTLGLLIGVVLVGSTLSPAASGFLVALGLGLTVNPKYATWFLAAGVFCALMGFAGSEPQIAWGGVALVISQVVVKLFIKS